MLQLLTDKLVDAVLHQATSMLWTDTEAWPLRIFKYKIVVTMIKYIATALKINLALWEANVQDFSHIHDLIILNPLKS